MKAGKDAQLMEVIVTNLLVRGNGMNTPMRQVTQYFSKEGELLAEFDPSPDYEHKLESYKEKALQNVKTIHDLTQKVDELQERLRKVLNMEVKDGEE